MNLFSEPTDIYSAVYNLILFNRILGTAPITLTQTPTRQFRTNNYLSMSSVIEILVILGTMWYLLSEIDDNVVRPFRVLKLCSSYAFGVISSICVLFGIMRAKYLVDGFKILFNIDEQLKSLGIWMCYRETRNKIMIQLFFVLIAFIFMFTCNIILIQQVQWVTMSNFVTSVPQCMIVAVELQYYNYLYLAMVRYRILNEYLMTLDKDKQVFRESPKKPPVSEIHGVRKLSAAILKTTSLLSNPYAILETVNDLHIQLTDICTMFNKAFSVQLLFRIATSFTAIIFALFFIIGDLGSMFNQYRDKVQVLSAVMVFMLVFCCLELYTLAKISDETCQEANTCPILLHKIKHNCTNTDLLNAIELYSIQMYHNRLQFTVCGLFPIDNSLLYTISGAITTYLIFLVQLSKSKGFQSAIKGSNETVITESSLE